MSELFHPHLLRLFPEHRSREQRTRLLTLDDLIDDYRITHTLKASEFDWLLMAYRYEHFFWPFLKKFTSRQLKPSGLIDLWRLAFAALLTRDQSIEQLTHAIVEESKKLFGPFTAAPTNAFCRQVLRQKTKMLASLEKHPTLLLGPDLEKRWGKSDLALRMGTALKTRPKSGFSFLKNDSTLAYESLEEFQKISSAQALSAASFDWMKYAFEKALPELKKKTSLRVLDMCAAPGGKLFALLTLFKKHSIAPKLIVANEAKFKRLERLKENMKRWQLSFDIQTQLGDWSEKSELKEFDIILADLPCTGLGTLPSRPDLLLENWSKIDPKLSTLQENLLKTAQSLKAKNGEIWLSICSSDSEECAQLTKAVKNDFVFQSHLNEQNPEEITGWIC